MHTFYLLMPTTNYYNLKAAAKTMYFMLQDLCIHNMYSKQLHWTVHLQYFPYSVCKI